MISRIKNSLRFRLHHWSRDRSSTAPPLPALDLTSFDISRRLFPAFPHLGPHPGASGIADLHFQDTELLGAIACTPSEATLLHLAAKQLQPHHPLEIGSYIGWSSAHIASAISGSLTCVDPFIEIGPNLRETTSEPAKQRFLDNMVRAKLTDHVRLACGKSPDILPSIAPAAGWDFVFVDGWHLNDQPLRDVLGILPYVSADSVLVFHDIWVRDVRDALLFLLTQDFNVYVCETANYLTFAWRGSMPDKLKELFHSPAWSQLSNAQSEAKRAAFGISSGTLSQFAKPFGAMALDRHLFN